MKWLYSYEPADGSNPSPQDMTLIDEMLGSLSSSPISHHSNNLHVACTYMRPPPPPEDLSNRAPCANQPAMQPCWRVLAYGPSNSRQCLIDREKESVIEADSHMEELMEKKLAYKETLTIKMEGKTYELDNGLLISPATVTHAASLGGQAAFLGHVVEVAVREGAAMKVDGRWPDDNVSRSIRDAMNEVLDSLTSSDDPRKAGISKARIDQGTIGGLAHQPPRLRLIECKVLENMLLKSSDFGPMQAAWYYTTVATVLKASQKSLNN